MSNYNEPTSEAFNVKEFILTALSFKYLYLASFVFCFSVAFFINKFSPTINEVTSIIGPIEEQRGAILESTGRFRGTGTFADSRNLQNDINSLISFSLVSSTLNKLNLEIGYFSESKSLLGPTKQIYPVAPFTVIIDKSHIQPINSRFYVDILNENSFRLRISEKDISLYNYVDNQVVSEHKAIEKDTICKFNETISNKNFKFSVSLNKEHYDAKAKEENHYFFELYHLLLVPELPGKTGSTSCQPQVLPD